MRRWPAVGGTSSAAEDEGAQDRLESARGPERVADRALEAVDRHRSCSGAEDVRQSGLLHRVVEDGSRAVGAHEAHVGGRAPGVREGCARPRARGRRRPGRGRVMWNASAAEP